MSADLEAARLHAPIPQKLEIFKQDECGHPHCTTCVPGRERYIVDKPAGMIVAKCDSWPLALEFADSYLRAALRDETTYFEWAS